MSSASIRGDWDKNLGKHGINDFNVKWLALVREKMKDSATIWISGTMHNIFSIGQMLTVLDFKILNIITWQKTNPLPSSGEKNFYLFDRANHLGAKVRESSALLRL